MHAFRTAGRPTRARDRSGMVLGLITIVRDTLRAQTHSLACSRRRDPQRGAAARTRAEVVVRSRECTRRRIGSGVPAAGLGAATTTIGSPRRCE